MPRGCSPSLNLDRATSRNGQLKYNGRENNVEVSLKYCAVRKNMNPVSNKLAGSGRTTYLEAGVAVAQLTDRCHIIETGNVSFCLKTS